MNLEVCLICLLWSSADGEGEQKVFLNGWSNLMLLNFDNNVQNFRCSTTFPKLPTSSFRCVSEGIQKVL